MRAIVLNSGGIDSTTCMGLARQLGYEIHSLTFDYGQKHRAELRAAEFNADRLHACSHYVADLSLLSRFAHSSLIDQAIEVPDYNGMVGIPSTYVPARNIVFLSIALSYAESRGAQTIFIGCSDVDYSGYPDCRPEFIAAFQQVANIGIKCAVEGEPIQIEAPLVKLNKSQVITKGLSLGVDYSGSVSCYRADDDGRACGTCDACTYRREGFRKAGVTDPTRYFSEEGTHA